jgi:hypothetical protein
MIRGSLLPAMGAVLAAALASASAAQQPDNSRTLPPAQAAQELARYADCLAARRGPQARAVALAPYLSDEQIRAADGLIRRVDDSCIQAGFDDVRITIRPDVLAGAVAEALLERDYPDFPAVVDRRRVDIEAERARAARLSVAERFGRCIVWSNPVGVQALLKTEPRSTAERDSMNALNHDMGMCVQEGSTLSLSRTFVRGIAGISGYRLAQQLRPRAYGERG